ncbi:BN860_10462g1_1 [Zygosaccharomyces bailii CLIB 213]|uniref:BN860_10462g1_1 n=1 Tax=Zygosaccharomyces bailii (strain CLIB 213 / ATCC 58445 / CBS 680 / BCRC 21525 / NBRC 1098 / NCYC 1416 / NRRL Y-2227) TaxID=1333698 RepID=A0A8J2T3V1_ZYGB2|nr:BN860_10462g1_1 [Zygosaccharomyces bailii CLIB 213]
MGGPVRSLVKHIYWERILPLLPYETGHGQYHEVESDETFLLNRAVTMDVSYSQGLNPVVEMSVELVEHILGKQAVLQVDEKAIQSILVLVRLLSDNMEYVWDCVEARRTREVRSRGGIGSVVGFSTHRPCFHCVSPHALDSELAVKLLDLCGKIKFDTNTLHMLQNMSQQLYGTTSFVSSTVLPQYQAYLKQRNVNGNAVKIDATVDYIFRFLSAANPGEFTRYLRHTVLKPFLESHSGVEQGVLHCLDLFGCFYLNKRNLAKYLEMTRNMASGMRKTVYHCLLLYYASRALMFWIMGRSEEYTHVFQLLRRSTGSGGNSSNSSNSNSSSTNSASGATASGTGNSIISINSNEVPSSSVPGSFGTSDEDLVKPVLPLASALFEETYSTFSVSSLLTSLTSYGNTSLSGGTATEGNDSNSGTPHSASSSMSFFSQPSLNSGPSGSSSNNLADQQVLDDPSVLSSSETPSLKWGSDGRPLQPEVPHMYNVLELYTTPDGSESLSHTSVLRFLIALLMLDPDVFTEVNATTFKNLPDAKGLPTSHSRSEPEEKEKIQGSIKHITHGLKKLTTLPLSRKKSVKLISTLVKNLTGSVLIADQATMDTIKSIVSLFTMASSVSLVDPTVPSVVFCKRLFPMMACNLDLGKNWERDAKLNVSLLKCLARHPIAYGRLQIEFFAASTRLEQNTFLSRLHLSEVGSGSNLKKLTLYTEGFHVFFHLPTTKELREGTALRTAELLKTLFYWIPDVILKSLPYFDGRITTIVSSIVDGTILEEIGGNHPIFKGSSHSSSSSLASLPNSQNVALGSPQSGSAQEVYSSPTSQGGAGVVRTNSNGSSSSDSSSGNIAVNPNDAYFGHLIAPKARRVSGNSSTAKKPFSVLIAAETSDVDKGQTNLRSQGGMNATVSTSEAATISSGYTSTTVNSSMGLARNIRSPLRHTRQRRGSDDTSVGPPRSSIFTATENTISSASREHDARRIMVNIFSIFKRITDYIVVPHIENVDPEWPEKDFKSIIKSIFSSMIDTDASLQKTAQSFMDVLINYMSEFSENISPGTMCGYYKLCSYTITLFSTALLDLKLSNHNREVLLDIVVKFLKVRGRLERNFEVESTKLDSFLELERSTFPIILGTVGRALFVSLYCNRNNVQMLLKNAYKEFYQMILFHIKISGDADPSWADNLGFAKAMSEDNYVASGSVAFQRRLRLNILKYVKYPDAIMFDVMSFIYKKWSSLVGTKNMSQEESSDFRSFGGIIASVCGVLLTVDTEKYPNLSEMRSDVGRHMNFFISRQCQSLNNPDLLTRENSRDILSTELHPLAFKLLFSNLKRKLDELKGIDLTASSHELSLVLLEQIIIILRTVLRREDEDKILLLFSVDVINFIDDIVDILEKMPNDSPKFFKAVIHMSKVFRAMENAEGNLGIVGHYYLKNKWLKQVTFWFKLTIDKDYDIENISKPHREMDLKRRDIDILLIDTAIESSKALAFLTKNVPLEVPPSVSEEELKRSKFVIFGNHFNILLKGLERSTDLDSFPPSLKHKISILNENVITSLTNLSNANVDAGLQYSLPMGFSKNKNIKIAFLKVFINIVNNISPSRDQSAKAKLKAQNDLLLYAIKDPSIVVLFTKICPANEIDSFAAGLVSAFDSRNASIVLVKELIKEEIRTAPRHMDILRRNSCATRALSLFARTRGNEYLVKILRPVLTELMDTEESFEVEKLNPKDQNTDLQVDLFVKYMKLLLDSITSSVDIFPPELVLICQTIYSAVEEKFPVYVYVAVGSFVFLRFFCPALVSPESENIVEISESPYKRPFITLAKVIQSLANGSDSVVKWPALESQEEFLEECRDRIFHFLRDICEKKYKMDISINMDPTPIPFDFNYLHTYLYLYDLDVRKATLDTFQTFSDFPRIKEQFLLVDEKLAILGQPKEQFRNEIPKDIVDNKEECPQLYEFMSRHAFKSVAIFNTNSTFVHESMSPDGLPIITLTFSAFRTLNIEVETVIYRTFRIYARIWTVKHYVVLDCTGFDENEVDVPKLTSLFNNLLPPIALENCQGYYYFNITESFINQWSKLFSKLNPYVAYKVPHYFVNSYSNSDFVSSLGLSAHSMEVVNDVRVSLHDIVLYDERKKRFTPVSLKIGNKYFQVLHETIKQYKIQGWDHLVDLKFNDVFQINHVSSVGISASTGVPSEFTVGLEGGRTLIFSSAKYLEIIKMFYYALARIEDEYGVIHMDSSFETGNNDSNKNEYEQRLKTVCHLLLIVVVGLFNEDDVVKNVSYNLLAATQDAFELDFGTRFHSSPEIHVPSDCGTFLCLISKSLSKNSPDLTRYVFEFFVNGLTNQIIPFDYIPQTIFFLSYWVPNLYKHVYLVDEEEGPEVMAQIIRSLIRLTISEPSFTAVYLQQVWFYLALEGCLTFLIVEEVLNHALDRDSENRDWKELLCLLNGLPTIEVASQIINRLMNIIKSILPSLKLESFTQSWSELTILVKATIPLFFEAPLVAQMFLPEALFITSLLIDVGPTEIRSSLYELLMNVCHSLTINEALPDANKQKLDEVCNTFSRQRFRFMSGFSQHKGRVLQTFSASSFATNFAALELFATNMLHLMEYSSISESPQWKTRYKKYLMDAVFNSDSFLSARAMMILGVMGKTNTTENLCKNFLDETMKIVADPHLTEELIFLLIAHVFTYSKVVEGLDPSSEMMKQLFWLSSVFVESPNPALFEGGLFFMANCLSRLYKYHFDNNHNGQLLTSILIKARYFAEAHLVELEEYNDGRWDERNFAHNIIVIISRGCSIPSVKGTALEFLLCQFRNCHREHKTHQKSTHYLCYMFFLYLFSTPENFRSIIQEAGCADDLIALDNNNLLPKRLLNWLSSNKSCPNITLYQGAVVFNSTVSDEPCKMRFALVMRHLSKVNPECVFNFYVATREELRRISALDKTSDCVPIAFDILRLIVKTPEVSELEKYNERSLASIRERGLGFMTKIDVFDQGASNVLDILEVHSDMIYRRKRAITIILSRMSSCD